MSGGLYSMQAKDFDQTLDLTKVKPYGDTMNDGKVQLSFTLPVPEGPEAVEAAKLLLKKMGFENPLVAFSKELTPGFTFFNCYGSLVHTVDYSNIYVPKVESTTMDMHVLLGDSLRYQYGIGLKFHRLCKQLFIWHLASEIICIEHIVSFQAVVAGITLHIHYGIYSYRMSVRSGTCPHHNEFAS